MKRLFIPALIISLYPNLSQGAEARQTFWSENARVLHVMESGEYKAISSPDRKINFTFNGNNFSFQNPKGTVLATLQDSVSSPELLEISWAPDAQHVFVNASDGGAYGTWSTYVFVRSGSKLREIPVEDLIDRRSNLRTDCHFKNMGSASWLKEHDDLLVIEQIPDSSGCMGMGKVAGYIFNVKTLKLIDRLNAEQVRARFFLQLGPQGKAALE